jgi:hypothetical protein
LFVHSSVTAIAETFAPRGLGNADGTSKAIIDETGTERQQIAWKNDHAIGGKAMNLLLSLWRKKRIFETYF